MNKAILTDLVQCLNQTFIPPFSGSIAEWALYNIELPTAYAIPGRLDFRTSPYLMQPLADMRDPKVRMVNLIAAVQTGKTLISETCVPFWIVEDAGPILKISQSDEIAQLFTETRLIPLLKNCKPVKPLLDFQKASVKKGGVILPHMSIKTAGAKDSMAHGQSVRYLLLDECHLYDFGLIDKFLARTTAFAGRRKIVISSTPDTAGSQLEKYYNFGQIYEWEWQCPSCKQYQPYYWNKQRMDGSYAGMNWDTIMTADQEHTDIARSARTAWLECFHCKHQVHDNISNRRMLNDTGKYVCVKTDGDPEVKSYTWPGFVNINLSFESFVIQYLTAKRVKNRTGLDEDVITFVNQALGKFYKADPQSDHSKIARGDYIPNPSEYDKQWVNIMTIDIQAKGNIKFYTVRAWNKKGNESRRLDMGATAKWDDIELIRRKWNVRIPCVGVDSGFDTTAVYQECIRHNEEFYDPKLKKKIFTSFVPMKGDGAKLSYQHEDKVSKYYAPLSSQDAMWPVDSKYHGRPARLLLWSNYSIKSILMQLRDGAIPHVKWLVDQKDDEYERQMYAEELREEIDKKTGQKRTRWIKVGEANEYLDCEAMNLVLAIRYDLFSPTQINEDELKKVVEKEQTK